VTPALRLTGLGKDYGARTAVGALDLEVARGEIFGLLGPNGAGKTTTILMACGVLTPSRGRIELCGIDLAADPFAAKARLGLVPQELALYDELTARQNLAYVGALYRLRGPALAAKIDWALGLAGLQDRAAEPVKQFSGGMKRRLNLAAGVLHTPDLLVLDEPTVGVDPQSRNHIFDTVRALRDGGMTVVYTSHYMEEIEALCDRVAIIDGGAVVARGTIGELVAAHAGAGFRLELTGDLDAALAAAAAHGDARLDGDALRLAPRAGLGPLLAAIEATGAIVTRLESPKAGLEAAFLALTGRALRDEA
jgi:ABC-2 type transport system ATP-binding protein